MALVIDISAKLDEKKNMEVAIEEIITRLQRTDIDNLSPEQALAILKSYKSLLPVSNRFDASRLTAEKITFFANGKAVTKDMPKALAENMVDVQTAFVINSHTIGMYNAGRFMS